jgi:hypothetical protein
MISWDFCCDQCSTLWFVVLNSYGNQGFEMVNITYVGDTLIARKVTGDENVPAGEISFQADLSPSNPTLSSFSKENDNNNKNNIRQPLSNIILSEEATKKWNTNELARYPGLGQVAEKGFKHNQWMDGQFVFINEDYFSFAWMPLNHQILFGRPSYDLTVKMLMDHRQNDRESMKNINDEEEDDDELCILPPSLDDDIDTLNKHVMKCFDATISLVEECNLQDEGCIYSYHDTDVCCFE